MQIRQPILRKRAAYGLIGLFGLVLSLILFTKPGQFLPDPGALVERFQTFVTIFLGIFIEAVPFLLAGSIVSGLIEVFVDQRILYRFIPRHPLLAAIAGAMLGLAFPVCECGVVPVTRRLYQKGLPLSVGIAFLLAAPVINPVVIASTFTAFGWGPMLWGRLGFSFLIAATVGYLFHLAKPEEVLLPEMRPVAEPTQALVGVGPLSPIGMLPSVSLANQDDHDHDHGGKPSGRQHFWRVLELGGEDFLDMGRYLIAGSMLAAGLQTLVPQSTLLAVGSGAVSSVLVMLALAFLLSVCSTVDAFLALAFINTFSSASVLGFLVFGPMVDIKSTLLYLSVFRRKAVAYMILLPLLITIAIGIYLNLNVGW